MRFLKATIALALLISVVSSDEYKNTPEEDAKQIKEDQVKSMNSLLSHVFYAGIESWKSSVEECLSNNDFYSQVKFIDNALAKGLNSTNLIKLKSYARACERVVRFYKNLKKALNKSLPKQNSMQCDADKFVLDTRRQKKFENNCRELCDYQAFLNSRVAECSSKNEAVSKNTETNSKVVSENETGPKINENNATVKIQNKNLRAYVPPFASSLLEKKATKKERLIADLRQIFVEWYPNRDDFQQFLLNVSSAMSLYFLGNNDVTWNERAFEIRMSELLELPSNHAEAKSWIDKYTKSMMNLYPFVAGKESVVIDSSNISVLFLDEDEILNAIKEKMNNNLAEWYPKNSEYFQTLVKVPGLLWSLLRSDAKAESNRTFFENNMRKVLNNATLSSNRTYALNLQIENILKDRYANFSKYHDLVVKNMEESVRNTFRADLIFNRKTMESHVQKGVQDTEHEIRFFKDLWINITTWYPAGRDFNVKLHEIAETEKFHLEPEADSIRSNKSVFDEFVVLVLSKPSYAPLVSMETTKRIESFLSGQYLEMKDYEDKVIKKFRKSDESLESKAKLLLNDVDFTNRVKTAIAEAESEIVDNAFYKFEAEFIAWLPKGEAFVEEFLSFVKKRNLTLKELKKFDRDDDFVFSRDSEHFKAFAEIHKILVETTIGSQVRNVLNGIDPERVDRNLEILEVGVPDILNQLTTVKTTKMRIGRFLFRIQNCVNSFNGTVDKFLGNPDYDDEVEKHILSDVCISDEICVKTNGIVNQNELKPYISAFIESKSKPKNLIIGGDKIGDVVIRAIYVGIQNLVQARANVNREAARCFVQFLKRENAVSSIYSPSLLFDDAEMAQKIQPFEKIYQNMYKRLLNGKPADGKPSR